MNENGKLKLRYTWPVIILFWILFWPVGLTLTCFRVSFEKPGLRGAMVLNIIGVFWYFFTVFMMVILLSGSEGVQGNDIAALVFCFALGVVHRMMAKKKRKKVLEAKSDIQKDLDQARTGDYTYVEPIKSAQNKAVSSKNAEREVVCKNCGATNIIHGSSGECEYCGSLIE